MSFNYHQKDLKNYVLAEVCSYSKERISIDDVTNENYISTENMFPDKVGITEASTLPNAKSVVRYDKGDTLISNIRPYFKKIWFADREGGASNDVLVFKNNSKKVFNKYLYYFLSQDKFFDYVMGTSKGTKMPRGDKDAIMKYDINLPPLDEQKAISKILSDLDEKIETNNKINKKLEEMAQAIFKQWFVDFEFPCIPENYKFSGAGKPSDFDKVCTYKRVGGLPIPDGHSWFVYVLLCEDETFYKGMTNDLYRRFYEHYTGIGAEWTKVHKPIKVIHYEKFNTQEEARKREEELKSGFGREWIKRQYEKYKKCLDTQEMSAGLPAHKTTNNSSFMTAGEMVESELGMIPKGWEVKKIKDLPLNVTDYVANGSFKSLKDNVTLHDEENYALYIRNTDLKCKFSSDKKYVDKCSYEFLEKTKLFGYEVIISNVGDVGSVYLCPLFDIPMTLGSNVIMVNTLENNMDLNIFIFRIFKSFIGQHLIDSITGGSAQPKFNKTDFRNIDLIIPSRDILEKYNEVAKNIESGILLNDIENKKVSIVRDTLLPKLMSGEIRVPLNNEEN